MDTEQFHFDYFDKLIGNGQLTPKIESLINEIKEILKNRKNEESSDYTHECLLLDKVFEEYIESKRQ